MTPALPPQFNLMKRKEFMPSHPRAADIDRDQPSFTSAVKANGNGDERRHGYGRGQ